MKKIVSIFVLLLFFAILLIFAILNTCSADRKILDSINVDSKSKFQLYIESNNLILKSGIETFTLTSNRNFELTEEQPKMHLINRGDRKYILITTVWATNKIGSSVSMWLYDCLNEKI
ncbi:MAG: hypothetical protein GX213_10420 [Clostridiaceae bacterium]|nr:hypothetical protein [Clostridiaceae bacterium]